MDSSRPLNRSFSNPDDSDYISTKKKNKTREDPLCIGLECHSSFTKSPKQVGVVGDFTILSCFLVTFHLKFTTCKKFFLSPGKRDVCNYQKKDPYS